MDDKTYADAVRRTLEYQLADLAVAACALWIALAEAAVKPSWLRRRVLVRLRARYTALLARRESLLRPPPGC